MPVPVPNWVTAQGLTVDKTITLQWSEAAAVNVTMNAPGLAVTLSGTTASWTITDNSTNEEGHRLYRRTNGGAYSVVSTALTGSETLVGGNTYDYYAVAFSGTAEGPASPVRTVAPTATAVSPFFVEDFSKYTSSTDLRVQRSADPTRHWTRLDQNAPATEILLDTTEGVPALGTTQCMRHQFRGNGAHEQACGMDFEFPGDWTLNKQIWVEIWTKFDANWLTNTYWQFRTTSNCTNLQVGEVAEGRAIADGQTYGGRVVGKTDNGDGTWFVYWHMNIGYGIATFNFEDLTLNPPRQGDVLTGKTSGVSFKYTSRGFHYHGNPDHKTWFFDMRPDKDRWGETHVGHSGDGFAVYVNVAPIDWTFHPADALFDGKWHRHRWQYKLSTVAVSPGVATGYDGIERFWLDDTLKVERLGWATPFIKGFSGMAIGRNHNMGFYPGYNTGYKTGSIRVWRENPGW